MHHVAIMRKSWGLIPKIISGEKTIESRWYTTKRAPWDKIHTGDTVFFKNSGEPIQASARVRDVLQFSFDDIHAIEKVVHTYAREICLPNTEVRTWPAIPRYGILIYLERPCVLEPFSITKKGFGGPTAWITVSDISSITL